MDCKICAKEIRHLDTAIKLVVGNWSDVAVNITHVNHTVIAHSECWANHYLDKGKVLI